MEPILERRFPNDYGRREYRKINAVSENKSENVEIVINDADKIRQQILEKFTVFSEKLVVIEKILYIFIE